MDTNNNIETSHLNTISMEATSNDDENKSISTSTFFLIAVFLVAMVVIIYYFQSAQKKKSEGFAISNVEDKEISNDLIHDNKFDIIKEVKLFLDKQTNYVMNMV